jgi:DNA-directed RNA polymerase alpha subunit
MKAKPCVTKWEIARSLIQLYPYNLYAAVVGLTADSEDAEDIFNCDASGLEAALEVLTPRERAVIEARFAGGMTYQEIGDAVTRTCRERARQIANKALRELRYPSRIRKYRRVYETLNAALREKEAVIEEERKTIARLREKIRALEYGPLPQAPKEAQKALGMTLEEIGLTVRPYNFLKRAGCNTVAGVLLRYQADDETTFYEKLLRARNVGKKSAAEIMRTLTDLGVFETEGGAAP